MLVHVEHQYESIDFEQNDSLQHGGPLSGTGTDANPKGLVSLTLPPLPMRMRAINTVRPADSAKTLLRSLRWGRELDMPSKRPTL